MERKTILHDEIGKCELCGLISVVQIHHKKPLALGGTNDTDNLICICESCHNKIHNGSKSDLVRLGIKKSKTSEREPLVSLIELHTAFLNLLADADFGAEKITGPEIIDIIFSLPIRHRRKPTNNFDLIMKKYNEAWDMWEAYLEEECHENNA